MNPRNLRQGPHQCCTAQDLPPRRHTGIIAVKIQIKYNVFLFLPVFALLNLSVILSVGNPANMVSLRWDENLLLFSEVPKNGWIMATVLFVMAASSVGMVWKSGGKDCL